MDQTRDALCNDIEHRLGRIACDAILDPSPDAVAAQVDAVATDLETAGMPDAIRMAPMFPARSSTSLISPSRCQPALRIWLVNS